MADRFNAIGIDDFPGDPARDFRPCSRAFHSVGGDDYEDFEPPYGDLEDREDYEAWLDSMAKHTSEQRCYPIGPALKKTRIGSSYKRDLINEFSWSVTRDKRFQNCHREYYYCYYGSWGGWDRMADPEIRELYIMKNLRTRPMWVGIVVHEFAERIVKARGREPADRIMKTLRERMEADWQTSAGGRFRSNPKHIVGLAEHYYGLPLTSDDFEADFHKAEQCIRTLYKSRAFRKIVRNPSVQILECEQLSSVEISGIKVWVKVDVAIQNGSEGIEIVDWKTGMNSEPGATRTQLAVYALYASARWHISVDDIVVREVCLSERYEIVHQVDDNLLCKTADHIIRSAERMKGLLINEEQNVAFERDFAMTADQHRCHRCNFRRACGRGDNNPTQEELKNVCDIPNQSPF